MSITKCQARRHIKGPAFAVYDFASQLAASSPVGKKELWASNDTIAVETGYTARTVGSARAKLMEDGWLIPLNNQKRTGHGGKFETSQFRIVEHDEWSMSHPGKCSPTSVRPSSVVPSTVGQLDRRRSDDITVVGGTYDKALKSTSHKSKPEKVKPEETDVGRPLASAPIDSVEQPVAKTIECRLAAKIRERGESLTEFINKYDYPKWWHQCEDGAAAMKYRIDTGSKLTTIGFCAAIAEVWVTNNERRLSPGVLCSKVLDECQREQCLWPPAFQQHRDEVMEAEKGRATA